MIAVRVPAADRQQNSQVQELGFRLIDTNLQFLRPAGQFELESRRSRFSEPDDADGVESIASTELRENRFFRDPEIDTDQAKRLKGAWARNFFSGRRGDWMVVAQVQDQLAGFLQLLKGKSGVLVIDQIAVDTLFQRQGLARDMIAYAEKHCAAESGIQVGTQLGNTASIRLYESLGFRYVSADYIYHLHLGEEK